jgi:hypothetical protein
MLGCSGHTNVEHSSESNQEDPVSANTIATDFPGTKLEEIALDGLEIMSASIRFAHGKNLTLCAVDGGGTTVVVSQNASRCDYLVSESIIEILQRIKSSAGAPGMAAREKTFMAPKTAQEKLLHEFLDELSHTS